MFKRNQMFAPLCIDDLQQNLFFDLAHRLGAKGHRFFGHHLVHGIAYSFCDCFIVDAVLLGPSYDWQVQTKVIYDVCIKTFAVPLFGIAARRHMHRNQVINHIAAHILHDVG